MQLANERAAGQGCSFFLARMFLECSCLGRDCSCLLGAVAPALCTEGAFLDISATPSMSICGDNNNNHNKAYAGRLAADKHTAASQTTRVGTEKTS